MATALAPALLLAALAAPALSLLAKLPVHRDILLDGAWCQLQVRRRGFLEMYRDIIAPRELLREEKIYEFKCNRVLDSIPDEERALEFLRELKDNDEVIRFSYGVGEYTISAKKFVEDEKFNRQWYINPPNSEMFSQGRVVDYVDINVFDVWKSGNKGQDSKIVIVDTGIVWNNTEFDPDTRYIPEYSYAYMNASETEYQPGDIYPTDKTMDHGSATTSLAIASMNNNGVCMTGVAPESHWSGRFVVDALGSTYRAINHALSANIENFQVSSNSWGYVTTSSILGSRYLTTPSIISAGFETGGLNGNDGKGVVYVFASGNDGDNGAGTNLGTECRDPYVICVGAVSASGEREDYATYGSSLFISAPSGGKTKWGDTAKLVTVRYSDSCGTYTSGTSFSCPLVSGVVLLMQSARNNELTRRDIVTILACTSKVIDDCSGEDQRSTCVYGGWNINSAGYAFSENYGFGLVDALASVEMAKNFSVHTPELEYKTIEKIFSKKPEGPKKVYLNNGSSVYDYVWEYEFDFSDTFIELDSVYSLCYWWGESDEAESTPNLSNLKIDVISPSGTRSRVTTEVIKTNLSSGPGYYYCRFGGDYLKSYSFWHEHSNGIWKIEVRYGNCLSNDDKCGSQEINSVGIKLEGTRNDVKLYYENCDSKNNSGCSIFYIKEGAEAKVNWIYSNADDFNSKGSMEFSYIYWNDNRLYSYNLGSANITSREFKFSVPTVETLGMVPSNSFICASRASENNCIHLIDVGAKENVIPNDGSYNLIRVSYERTDILQEDISNSENFQIEESMNSNIKITSPSNNEIIYSNDKETISISWSTDENGKAVCDGETYDYIQIMGGFINKNSKETVDAIGYNISSSSEQGEAVISLIPGYQGYLNLTIYCSSQAENPDTLKEGDKIQVIYSRDEIWISNIAIKGKDGDKITEIESYDPVIVSFKAGKGLTNSNKVANISFICENSDDIYGQTYTTCGSKTLSSENNEVEMYTPIEVSGVCKVIISSGLYAKTSEKFSLKQRETIQLEHVGDLKKDKSTDIKINRGPSFDGVPVNIVIMNVDNGYSKTSSSDDIIITTTEDSVSLNSSQIKNADPYTAVACASLINCDQSSKQCVKLYKTNCVYSNEFVVFKSGLSVGEIACIVVVVILVVVGVTVILVVCLKKRKSRTRANISEDIDKNIIDTSAGIISEGSQNFVDDRY